MKWWWLSFCDGDRPEGQQFVGVCVVQGHTMIEAVKASWALGCNPGGEVCGFLCPPQDGPPPNGCADRLLSRSEVEAMVRLWTPESPGLITLGQAADEGNALARKIVGDDGD